MLSLKEARAIIDYIDAAVAYGNFDGGTTFAMLRKRRQELCDIARANDNAEAAKIRTRYDPADNLGPETDHDI